MCTFICTCVYTCVRVCLHMCVCARMCLVYQGTWEREKIPFGITTYSRLIFMEKRSSREKWSKRNLWDPLFLSRHWVVELDRRDTSGTPTGTSLTDRRRSGPTVPTTITPGTEGHIRFRCFVDDTADPDPSSPSGEGLTLHSRTRTGNRIR